MTSIFSAEIARHVIVNDLIITDVLARFRDLTCCSGPGIFRLGLALNTRVKLSKRVLSKREIRNQLSDPVMISKSLLYLPTAINRNLEEFVELHNGNIQRFLISHQKFHFTFSGETKNSH
jgi:hypothetical protein